MVKQRDTEIVFRFCEWGMATMEPSTFTGRTHLFNQENLKEVKDYG